jgi:hypothetical protein
LKKNESRLNTWMLEWIFMKFRMYIMASESIPTAYFIHCSHQFERLYLYPPVVDRQRPSKHITAANNTRNRRRIVGRVVRKLVLPRASCIVKVLLFPQTYLFYFAYFRVSVDADVFFLRCYVCTCYDVIRAAAFLMEKFFLVVFFLCSSGGWSCVGEFSADSGDRVDLWLVITNIHAITESPLAFKQ